jgi:hypothetical protein
MSALDHSRPGRTSGRFGDVRYASKAKAKSEYWFLPPSPLRVDGAGLHVIQAPKLEPRIMRYELSDFELAASNRCCRTNRAACRV